MRWRSRFAICTLRQRCCANALSSAELNSFDHNRLQHHIFVWTVVASAREVGDLVCDLLPVDYFAENRVLAGEPLSSRDSDKELRAIRVWPGVGHGEFARLVEFVWRVPGLIFKLITRATETGTGRIAALDHEIGDHAMEDCAVIKAV